MNKEELIEKIISSKVVVTTPGTEGYDHPETQEMVPVWWIKHSFNEAFPPKPKDDDKYYKSSSYGRDDMGDVDEY